MVERYKPNGTPLMDYERELLVITMEEAGEVIQACSKLIRFGKENRPDGDRKGNNEYLALEIGDFQEMVNQLWKANLIQMGHVKEGQARKKERLARFMQTAAGDTPASDGETQ